MSADVLHWNAQALWQALEPLLPGLSIEVVARSASTSSALLERARIGVGGPGADPAPADHPDAPAFGRRAADLQPCLLVAEHQTEGRGRQGKRWQSAPGASLTFSLLLPLARGDWSGLSLALGVALADALDPPGGVAGPRIGIKWPNDLWLLDAPLAARDAADPAAGVAADTGAPGAAPRGRKLGGILIETVASGCHRLVVAGVGLNVRPLDSPDPALSCGYACLQEIDPTTSAPAALAQVAVPLARALRRFERDGYAGFAAGYAARDLLRGCRVLTTLPGVPEGVAGGVTAQGALRVLTAVGWKDVASGEVSVRLPDGPAPC
ncbi:MAG: biotin--[acetyl-CoA-carboxylase] ligase [Burkholderiaceae bacterium]